MIYNEPKFLTGGDRYLLIEFGNEMNLDLNFLAQGLASVILEQKINGIIETAPCFASMLVHYDPDIISKTDWNLPRETKREYKDLFYKMIEPYLNKMTDKLKFKQCKISNIWYQSYEKNSTHAWHVHPEVNYTHVYYLNLPEKKVAL